MDVLRNRSYLFGIPLVAMAVLWAEIYIFKQDDNTRMKLIKFQLVFLLEVIMSCLTALVMKFSQKIPALTGKSCCGGVRVSYQVTSIAGNGFNLPHQ